MSSPPSNSWKRKLTPDYVTEDLEAEDSNRESSTSSPRESKKKESKVQSGEKSAKQNEEGETYFEVSGKRRVTIRKFKGNVLVDIREYWEPESGKMAPGKKGISLSVDQWELLKSISKDIDEAIKEIKK